MDKAFEIDGYELLSKKVYRILKERILDGDFEQGSKMLESRIAKQLGVSRTPIREAIRQLSAEGLVQISPNQGVVISPISIKDIQDILQLRGALEGLAARLVVENITKENIAELEKYNNNMAVYASENDVVKFIEESEKFHGLILQICGNKRLVQIRKNLDNQIHRYRRISLNIPGRLKHAQEEHVKITEAIKQRDPLKADQLSEAHIQKVFENILNVFDDDR